MHCGHTAVQKASNLYVFLLLPQIADVWLEDTTGTRVAQWKNVPVTAYVGIAQMEFQLSEEPPQVHGLLHSHLNCIDFLVIVVLIFFLVYPPPPPPVYTTQ